MNENQMRIKESLSTLVKLMLTPGIKPSELADNVFLKDYKSISFFKKNEMTVGELTFIEIIGNNSYDVLLRYYYDTSKRVILIEEELNGKNTIVWDREASEIEIINEIVYLLKTYEPRNITNFLSSLPTELSNKVLNQYKRVI